MEKVFKVADIRDLEQKVALGEMSYSRMVEVLNEKTEEYYSKVKKLNEPAVSKSDEPVSETTVCDTCRYSKSMKHHDYMWCRDCQQGSHYEQTVC